LVHPDEQLLDPESGQSLLMLKQSISAEVVGPSTPSFPGAAQPMRGQAGLISAEAEILDVA
jgi:hypothetical protein